MDVYLPLSGLIDKEKELIRLNRMAEKIRKDMSALEGRLNSKGFADKAKPEVVLEARNNLNDKIAQLNSILKNIAELE